MVPIEQTPEQILCYIYLSIVAGYLNFVKSLLGVTGSPVRNVCAEFGVYFYHILLLFFLKI